MLYNPAQKPKNLPHFTSSPHITSVLDSEKVLNARSLRAGRKVEGVHHVDHSRRFDQTLKSGHRAGNRSLAEESHDAEHRKPAVVELDPEPRGLPLLALALLEPEGVEEVEGHGVRRREGLFLEVRVDAGLSSPHVVLKLR